MKISGTICVLGFIFLTHTLGLPAFQSHPNSKYSIKAIAVADDIKAHVLESLQADEKKRLYDGKPLKIPQELTLPLDFKEIVSRNGNYSLVNGTISSNGTDIDDLDTNEFGWGWGGCCGGWGGWGGWGGGWGGWGGWGGGWGGWGGWGGPWG